MNVETQSPGWYPDPELPDRLRYWDGDGWTDRRRDRPEWLTGQSGSPPSTGKKTMSGRRLLTVVVVIGVVLCAFVWVTIPKRPARNVGDRSFLAAASAKCHKLVPELRAQRHPTRQLSDREVAARIDQVADDMTTMVSEIRDLPVASADRVKVERWLRSWDGYIAVGHRYAAAIRTGDSSKSELVRREGDDEADAIGRFASGNRIDDCIPYSLSGR